MTIATDMQPQTLGAIIDRYRKVYEQRAELNAQAKTLGKELEELQVTLLRHMDELQLEGAKGTLGSARVEEKIYPQVEDWDVFYQHIKENDAWFLLERRPTSTAYQELVAAGETVPGVKSWIKRTAVITAK